MATSKALSVKRPRVLRSKVIYLPLGNQQTIREYVAAFEAANRLVLTGSGADCIPSTGAA